MNKRPSILYGILFGILMAFLFSFMIQEHLKPFKTKELVGYFQKPTKPKFSWKAFNHGYFQKHVEKYLANNYGFREPIIRLYHQYCWDFFGKEYVSFIHSGKQKWLYYSHNLEDYYGTEMYHWFPDNEAARCGYERQVRLLNKVRDILAEYDVTLLTFIAPSKSTIYPEYLPQRKHDTTTLNAREYFVQRFAETGLPCFDMTKYFLQMKDTCSFCLFPPTGDHWNFSCVYAIDSLYRFMESQRGIHLTKIEYGDTYSDICSIGDVYNRDLEGQLNLLRPIKTKPEFAYKERDYHLTADSTTTTPSALFIGNSFLLRSMSYLPPHKTFSDFELWYYNCEVYKDVDQPTDGVNQINRLERLLNHDFIVWFTSASQMYRATEGFAEDAIIQLCIGDERFSQRKGQLVDSLLHDQDFRKGTQRNCSEELYMKKLDKYADSLMRKDPEAYFPEIAGKTVPETRNPLITKELQKQKICKNTRKKALLEIKAKQESLDFYKVLDLEANYITRGKQSLTNNVNLTAYDFFYIEAKVLMDSLIHSPNIVDSLINLKSRTPFEVPLFDIAIQQLTQRIEEGYYNSNPVATKSFELQTIMEKMNNPTSLARTIEKSKKQGKSIEKTILDDVEWIYQHTNEHKHMNTAEILTLLEKFSIEYKFRNNPTSMERIRQKAKEKDKPLMFTIMDDVNYVMQTKQK